MIQVGSSCSCFPECGGKVGQREVKARYQRFLNFHWKELLHLQMTATTSIKNYLSTDDWKRKVAVGFAQCGEISRAAKTLTSQGEPLVGEEIHWHPNTLLVMSRYSF